MGIVERDIAPTFPSASELPRTVSAWACVVVAMGGAVLITVSLGPMAQAVGNLSPLVWTAIALVGAAQCALLAELASCFPSRAGGTPQYAHRAAAGGSPLLGALSSWSYWLAWTPGIAVNLILAGEYLSATVWQGADSMLLTIALGAAIYLLNSAGLRPTLYAALVVGTVVAIPLLMIVVSPLLAAGTFDAGAVLDLSLPAEARDSGDTLALLAKWAFVAAWAAYGAEMASTLVAEVRDASAAMPRVMAVSAATALFTFSAVPVVLIGLVGAGSIAGAPETAFLPPAEAVFGDAGRTVVGLMLTAGLLLSAQAFVVGSSRTIYQLARDGHIPRFFSRANRRGVPIGSIFCDAAVIAVMLAVFGRDVVEVIAAANVAYLVVFVLMPIAYVRLRAERPEHDAGYRLGGWARPLALGLAVFNLVLLVWGGWQWGASVMLTGAALTALIVPISYLTARARRARSSDPARPA